VDRRLVLAGLGLREPLCTRLENSGTRIGPMALDPQRHFGRPSSPILRGKTFGRLASGERSGSMPVGYSFDLPGWRSASGCQGASGRSCNECRPRAFASSGVRTRAISVALSQSSQRIVTSAPPPERARTSSFGTGSEDPQSGQVRPLSRAIPAARRLCWSESRTLPVYPPSTVDAPDAAVGEPG
jgi:hypothetical protein